MSNCRVEDLKYTQDMKITNTQIGKLKKMKMWKDEKTKYGSVKYENLKIWEIDN